MTNIRSRYVRPRPRGITFTRGTCPIEGCEETQLGTSGLCRKTHESQFLKGIRAEAPVDRSSLQCHCGVPIPTNDGPMLRLYGTVQCDLCGRAIFDENGKQMHTDLDVFINVANRTGRTA